MIFTFNKKSDIHNFVKFNIDSNPNIENKLWMFTGTIYQQE